jgi:phenylalanyl-tRNA synthetase beta subunit
MAGQDAARTRHTRREHDTILEVVVPPTRSDILHPVDIAEDIGIAFGYNNIIKKVPTTCTVGGEFPSTRSVTCCAKKLVAPDTRKS